MPVQVQDVATLSSVREDQEGGGDQGGLFPRTPPQQPSPQTPRSISPTPSTESESSSTAEGGTSSRRPSPPPCSMKERVREL